jgi:hypothetical protein
MRFYQVTSAYSALHDNLVYVRLVYETSALSVVGVDQINIVVYQQCGQFYIDRNDFLATNTFSFGRNDWISLFAPVPDFTTYAAYNRVSQLFDGYYRAFWQGYAINDWKYFGSIHVISFGNATVVPVKDQNKTVVLNITANDIFPINNFNWTLTAKGSN